MSDIEQLVGSLVQTLNDCALEYADEHSIYFDSESKYSLSTNANEDIYFHEVKLSYNTFSVILYFYPIYGEWKSYVLSSSISFKYEEQEILVPLTSIFGYFKKFPPNPVLIPFVTTEDAMNETFLLMMRNVEDIKDDIDYLVIHKEILSDFLMKEINYFKVDIEDSKVFEQLNIIYGTMQSLSLDRELLWHLLGSHEKLIKSLKKSKELTPYEQLLIKFLEDNPEYKPKLVKDVENNIKESLEYSSMKGEFRYGIAAILISFVISFIWAPLYIVEYIFIKALISRNYLLVINNVSSFEIIILFSFLSGLLTMYQNQGFIQRLVFKKKFNNLLFIQRSSTSRTFKLKLVMILVFLISIPFMYLSANHNIGVDTFGFFDNTSYWKLNGKSYKFYEVDYLEYKKEEYDTPTYSIVLKDGKKLNFGYKYDTANKEFLELFESNGIEIRE